MADGALAGVTVLVTRPAEGAPRLSQALEAEGATVIEAPAIRIEPPRSWEPLDTAIQRGGYHWVVFTSANGVRFFFERLRARNHDAAWFRDTRVAAIGPETARSLHAEGVTPALVPEEYVAEALVASLTDGVALRGTRVLLPRADIARDTLAVGLEREGATVETVVAYRTLPAELPSELIQRLRHGGIGVVTFTSSSTVRSLVAAMGPEAEALDRAIIACIGPITAATAREAGLRTDIVATTYTIPGLVEAIRKAHPPELRMKSEE